MSDGICGLHIDLFLVVDPVDAALEEFARTKVLAQGRHKYASYGF